MNALPHDAVTDGLQGARNLRLAQRLRQADPANESMGLVREGVLRRAVGLTLEASGCSAPMGSRCRVATSGGRWVDAEVVGFSGERTFLMPTGDLQGLLPNARVIATRTKGEVAVGEGLLGRVIDNDGAPLDGKGRSAPKATSPWPACRSIRSRASRSSNRSMSACAPSTPCCPSAAASAWACSRARAWASRRCWA